MNDLVETTPSSDDRNMAMLAHLLGILGFIPSLIIWLIKKDQSRYVTEEAREALNFQITMLIGYFISSVLVFILIGFVTGTLLYFVNIIFCILGAMAASKGQTYRYPFAIRLVN